MRWIGIVFVGLVGIGLLVPSVGTLLEYPFVKLSRGRPLTNGGGFVLGLSLGLVFVPCAGPVLAAITVVGATHHVGFSAVLLTLAFSCGVAVPLLILAIGGGIFISKFLFIVLLVALVVFAMGRRGTA